MSVSRFLIIIIALAVSGCAMLPTGGKSTLLEHPQRSGEQPPAGTPSPRVRSYPDSRAVVQKYYAAVAEHDIDAALSLVALDVVRVEIPPSDCAWHVVKGLPAIESELEYSNVLSFTVEDFQTQGNVTTYTLTEWLDPRTVGPNFAQPVRSHMTAVVNHGEITHFTLRRDSPRPEKEGQTALKVCSPF